MNQVLFRDGYYVEFRQISDQGFGYTAALKNIENTQLCFINCRSGSLISILEILKPFKNLTSNFQLFLSLVEEVI